jgi:hypothetical protein
MIHPTYKVNFEEMFAKREGAAEEEIKTGGQGRIFHGSPEPESTLLADWLGGARPAGLGCLLGGTLTAGRGLTCWRGLD